MTYACKQAPVHAREVLCIVAPELPEVYAYCQNLHTAAWAFEILTSSKEVLILLHGMLMPGIRSYLRLCAYGNGVALLD